MRVAVVGGQGFLGQRTVRALRALPGVEVHAASRRASLRVDLTRPETFEALRGFDLLVDLSDGTRVPPDALAAFCLGEGLTLLEATSDAPTIDRLYDRHGGGTHKGTLVLGGGIFTGMSNLLGASAARSVGACSKLTVGISSGPFSGAGASTIALMVSAMSLPALRVEGGQAVQCPPVSRGPSLAFAQGERATLRMRFAEATMLHHSTHVPEVNVFFAPSPGFLVPSFLVLPLWLLRSRAFGMFLGAYFTVLRRGLLRAVSTQVQLVAEAQGEGASVRRTLVASDGMDAAAWALCATVEQLAAQGTAGLGVRFVDELVTLEPVVERANALAGREVLRLG